MPREQAGGGQNAARKDLDNGGQKLEAQGTKGQEKESGLRLDRPVICSKTCLYEAGFYIHMVD